MGTEAFALYKLNKMDEARAAVDKALSYDQEWQYALDLKDLIENPESRKCHSVTVWERNK